MQPKPLLETEWNDLNDEQKLSIAQACSALSNSEAIQYLFNDMVMKLQNSPYSTSKYNPALAETVFYQVNAIKSIQQQIKNLARNEKHLQEVVNAKYG